jgi:hypothetical protein
MPIWLVIAIPVLGATLVYFLKNWFSEYKFFKSHDWDYSTDNPAALHMYKGENTPQTEENRVSNTERMNFGYPFFIFVVGVIFLGFLFCAYQIQTCDADDLKKCGINVKNGSVTIGGS